MNQSQFKSQNQRTAKLITDSDTLTDILNVPRTRFELVRFPATPSKWCVCQFRHLGI